MIGDQLNDPHGKYLSEDSFGIFIKEQNTEPPQNLFKNQHQKRRSMIKEPKHKALPESEEAYVYESSDKAGLEKKRVSILD